MNSRTIVLLLLLAAMIGMTAPVYARRASCEDALYYRLAEIGNEQVACLNSWQAIIPNYCQGIASIQAAAAFVTYASCQEPIDQ